MEVFGALGLAYCAAPVLILGLLIFLANRGAELEARDEADLRALIDKREPYQNG